MPLDKSVGMAFVNAVGAAVDTVVVAAVPDRRIRVLAAAISPAAATPPASVVFNTKPAGAGSAISATFGLVAGVPAVLPEGGGWFQTGRGEGLSISTGSGVGNVGIQVTYAVITP